MDTYRGTKQAVDFILSLQSLLKGQPLKNQYMGLGVRRRKHSWQPWHYKLAFDRHTADNKGWLELEEEGDGAEDDVPVTAL